MQQEMPFALVRQSSLVGLLDEFLRIGRGGFFRLDGGREKEGGQQRQPKYARLKADKRTGLRSATGALSSVFSEKPT